MGGFSGSPDKIPNRYFPQLIVLHFFFLRKKMIGEDTKRRRTNNCQPRCKDESYNHRIHDLSMGALSFYRKPQSSVIMPFIAQDGKNLPIFQKCQFYEMAWMTGLPKKLMEIGMVVAKCFMGLLLDTLSVRTYRSKESLIVVRAGWEG